jgi:SAM-dependent methyltransferase
MRCLFCSSSSLHATALQPTCFGEKHFAYIKCSDCGLIFVDPLPDARDMELMYPVSYQDGADAGLLPDPSKKMPGLRFDYAYQFELLEKFAPAKELLDHGCGTGHFIANAVPAGFLCTGTEFNPAQVQALRNGIPSTVFLTVDEFLSSEKKFPVIRMSNVLEHLTNPAETLQQLHDRLEPGGVLLVEGPLENNFSPAFLALRLYFLALHYLRPSFLFHEPPRHIFYSDHRNQRDLFVMAGFEELHFEVREFAWPFPESWSACRSAGDRMKYLLARGSMALCALVPRWGNTFLYVGRKRDQR